MMYVRSIIRRGSIEYKARVNPRNVGDFEFILSDGSVVGLEGINGLIGVFDLGREVGVFALDEAKLYILDNLIIEEYSVNPNIFLYYLAKCADIRFFFELSTPFGQLTKDMDDIASMFIRSDKLVMKTVGGYEIQIGVTDSDNNTVSYYKYTIRDSVMARAKLLCT